MDLIGQVGGVYGLIRIFFEVFLGFVSEKFYHRSIIKRLYQYNSQDMTCEGNKSIQRTATPPISNSRNHSNHVEGGENESRVPNSAERWEFEGGSDSDHNESYEESKELSIRSPVKGDFDSGINYNNSINSHQSEFSERAEKNTAKDLISRVKESIKNRRRLKL